MASTTGIFHHLNGDDDSLDVSLFFFKQLLIEAEEKRRKLLLEEDNRVKDQKSKLQMLNQEIKVFLRNRILSFDLINDIGS